MTLAQGAMPPPRTHEYVLYALTALALGAFLCLAQGCASDVAVNQKARDLAQNLRDQIRAVEGASQPAAGIPYEDWRAGWRALDRAAAGVQTEVNR